MTTIPLVSKWLERILGHEGGFSLVSADPGNWTGGTVGHGTLKGTKWGIAANTYPDLDIRHLTKEQAADIYIRDYLSKLQAHLLEDGVAFQLLDFAINSGPKRAIKALQWAVHAEPDGDLGPVTLAAVAKYSESDLVMLLIAARLDFMADLPTWPSFGRGWAHRLADNLRYAAEDTE
mgnify:CR=1 FL=1